MLLSNVVKKETLRKVQLETIEFLRDSLKCSFGPKGTYTQIDKQGMLSKFSKDGHTILGNIFFRGVIENSVKDNLEDLTKYIVKEVGDGTTSAVILSAIIFRALVEMESDKLPSQIIADFKAVVKQIAADIKEHGRAATAEDMYDIALVSTDSNAEIAQNIYDIYKEFGMNVFIDVAISNTAENKINIYDGMTIEAGYADASFINQSKKGICSIRNPRIYVFQDPIDTAEMVTFVDTIIENNIFNAYNNNDINAIIPTVILAPKMSRDMDSFMDKLVEFMVTQEGANRPPFLMVTNIYEAEQFLDMARLCGAKPIKKYLDLKLQAKDIESGLAPTPATICDNFYGSCALIEADGLKTKFVQPAKMKNEDGTPTDLFTGVLSFLESELARAKKDGLDANVTGNLKRRINSLNANLVEYLVGGVSMSDRDSLRDLVEDAVKNCRNAALTGVGYGANFEGFKASSEIVKDKSATEVAKGQTYMYDLILKAYHTLTILLYETCMDKESAAAATVNSLIEGCPINLRTGEFDHKILSSINSDIVILETIGKIVTLMFTSNQFICETPLHNLYFEDKEITS